jgi:hypothetical protein
LKDFGERYVRVRALDKIQCRAKFAIVQHAASDNDGTCAALGEELPITWLNQKGNFPRPRFVDGGGFMNDDAAISDQPPFDKMREFTERLACRHLFLHPAIVSVDHLGGDIDCLIAV